MSMMDLAMNPLKLQFGNVQTQYIAEEKSLAEILRTYIKGNARLICWQRQRIVWGTWQNQQLAVADGSVLDERKIIEIRVFNEKEEIHLVKKRKQYIGRYLQDGIGTETAYVDSLSRFFGKKSSIQGEYITLRDTERFLTLTIPCEDKNAVFYGLVTRNYIAANETTGQAGYSDYRFVQITAAEGANKI